MKKLLGLGRPAEPANMYEATLGPQVDYPTCNRVALDIINTPNTTDIIKPSDGHYSFGGYRISHVLDRYEAALKGDCPSAPAELTQNIQQSLGILQLKLHLYREARKERKAQEGVLAGLGSKLSNFGKDSWHLATKGHIDDRTTPLLQRIVALINTCNALSPAHHSSWGDGTTI